MKQTKVAFFSKWHAADGTSVLAELIGRELAKECDLTIFAPINDVKPVQGMTDEDFVIRCCSVQGTSSGQWNLDPKPFLEKDYDILIAQRIEWIPMTCPPKSSPVLMLDWRIKGGNKWPRKHILQSRSLIS